MSVPEKPTYEELEQRIKELEQAESEHKQVEEFMRESEERYKNIFKNNHSVMLIINPENADIVDANPAATLFYGWTHGKITRKKITILISSQKSKYFRKWRKQSRTIVEIFISDTVLQMVKSLMLKYTAALLNFTARSFYFR